MVLPLIVLSQLSPSILRAWLERVCMCWEGQECREWDTESFIVNFTFFFRFSTMVWYVSRLVRTGRMLTSPSLQPSPVWEGQLQNYQLDWSTSNDNNECTVKVMLSLIAPSSLCDQPLLHIATKSGGFFFSLGASSYAESDVRSL